jgi:tripartite-type tricarboxylate transporter receptor subunit TctC
MMRRCVALAARLAASGLAMLPLVCGPAGDAVAQSWPNRTVRMVVPFAPGGGVDTLARLVGTKMSELTGQPVVIEHRPGAGGNLGADAVAKSPPDGYTMLLAVSGLAVAPSLYRTLPYDPRKDLVPVTEVVSSSLVLLVTPRLPVKSVQELVALAKSKPGTLNYGSSGLGAPLHLTMEIFKSSAGIDIQHVPFRGDAPLNAALIAGNIELAFVPQLTGLPLIQGGQVRGLAVTGGKRVAAHPDLPTVTEAGVRGLEVASWNGLFVPAGTPRETVAAIRQIVVRVLATDVGERIRTTGNEPVGSTPEAFAVKFRADVARFAKAIEDAKIPKLD